MFVLSRLFVQSLNIPSQKELEGTKLLKELCMSGSILCYLTIHGAFCLPVSDGWLIPYSFLTSSGLLLHHQGLPCWVVGSGLSETLSPPTLHLYLPAFISTLQNDTVEVHFAHKVWRWPRRAHQQARAGMGMAKQPLSCIIIMFFPSQEMCIPAVLFGWPQLPISHSTACSQPLWGGHPCRWFLFPCPFSLPEPDIIVSLGTV